MAMTIRPNKGILGNFIFPDNKFSAKINLFPNKLLLNSAEMSKRHIVV